MSTTFDNSDQIREHQYGKKRTVKQRFGRLFSIVGVLVIVGLIAYAVFEALGSSSSANSGTPGTGIVTTSPIVGTPAPRFVLPSLRKASVSLSLAQLLGKPVVLNFFSPACIPCRLEMPTFAKLGQEYRGKINFAGVDETSSGGAALSMINNARVHYPVAIDANGDLVGPYLIPGVPVTVFIGANGIIRGYIAGAISQSTLLTQTKQLL